VIPKLVHSTLNKPFGVYVHIPFCARRCDYCSFAIWTDRGHLQQSFVDAVVLDVERAVTAGMRPADTVFFGGGTPSLLPGELLVRILDALPRLKGAEVSVECNPDDVSPELFATYAAHGVTRVSLGVQSLVPEVLVALGRSHNVENVRNGVAWARAAGLSINTDIIYGGAGETIEDWLTTVDGVLALEPDHLSAYALTVEPGTPLARHKDRHPDDDDQADKYLLADAKLSAAGYKNYEISNWSKPGQSCRHNQLYWDQANYRGFGCAAHSHENGRRWWNLRTPDRYIAAVQANETTEASFELLDLEARRIEGLQLALRTQLGIPASSYSEADLGEFVGGGLLEFCDRTDGHRGVRLTVPGRMMANALSLAIIGA
jgi:putative oxygen-independent coproporphyrinogen III oxidase